MSELPKIDGPDLPQTRIEPLVTPLARFIRMESLGGAVLLLATIVALVLANSQWNSLLSIWDDKAGIFIGDWNWSHPIRHWVNDGLLTIFFFVVGLEVKRELMEGELSTPGALWLPVAAAVGGMVVPAGIYLMLMGDGEARSGWGAVMATDIAFVLGCLAILGKRVPDSLRVFMITVAIVDDIGAILVIALGYGHGFHAIPFLTACLLFGVIWMCQWLGVRNMAIYWLIGFLMWAALHESGIHPTIAGVALGLLTPVHPWVNRTRLTQFIDWAGEKFAGMSGNGFDPVYKAAIRARLAEAARESISPLTRLEHILHPLSSFLIMPIFALANAGIVFAASRLLDPLSMAIVVSLMVGKPLGIFLCARLAVALGVATRPSGTSWSLLCVTSSLAGIGFTMALFIATLAFEDSHLETAKTGILMASVCSAFLGSLLILLLTRSTSMKVAGGMQDG